MGREINRANKKTVDRIIATEATLVDMKPARKVVARPLSPAAFSIGRQAYERIQKSHGSIHSCYRGAINVQTETGLVCVVPRAAGRGPLNINIDAGALTGAGNLASGSPVAMSAQGLAFQNGLCVSLSNVEVYEPTGRFEGALLRPRAIERNITLARRTALLMGHLEGVGELLEAIGGGRGAAPLRSPFSLAALPHVKSLLRAIRARNVVAAEEATKELVGLGIGLTPSADDMLSGIMVSLVLGSLNGIGGDIGGVVSGIGRACRGRTSALSQEFLFQAASGRANERVTCLVERICTGGAGEVRDAVLDAVKIGETSGTDMVVGVILGVKAALEPEVAGA